MFRNLEKYRVLCRPRLLTAGFWPKASGFTILETAVVLAIMVLIAGAGITIASAVLEINRVEETYERMDQIMDGLTAYKNKYGYLPCPAGEREYSDDNFGIDEGTNQDDDECDDRCEAPNLLTADSERIAAGTIPVRTLSMDPRLILDGWNRRFTYVVDSYLTCDDSGGAGAGSGPGYEDTTTGALTVKNAGGTNITTTAAAILISHGRNGHGAWAVRSGTRLSVASPSALEQQNAHIGQAYDSTFVQSPLASDFDDIMLYQSKWRFDNDD